MSATVEPTLEIAPAHKSLAEALAAFQGEAPKLHKGNSVEVKSQRTGAKYSYKYIDLAAIVDEIQPIMVKHGLSFSAFPSVGDGKPALRYVLRHSSGDLESDTMPLMLAAADAQGLGSAITYARRYALCAVLNLVADEDDDGAAATAAARAPAAPRVEPVDAGGVKWLKDAAAGLKMGQIKMAFAGCGLSTPEPFGFHEVPKAKAAQLMSALAGMEREG